MPGTPNSGSFKGWRTFAYTSIATWIQGCLLHEAMNDPTDSAPAASWAGVFLRALILMDRASEAFV